MPRDLLTWPVSLPSDCNLQWLRDLIRISGRLQSRPDDFYTMDMKELESRMHEFVASKGWYEVGSPKKQSPRNLAVSLIIEAAEVLEHFQWREQPDDLTDLPDELADVGLYLLQLASVLDIDLESAILNKLAKNKDRDWSAD